MIKKLPLAQLTNELRFLHVECQRTRELVLDDAARAADARKQADERGDVGESAYQRGKMEGLKRAYRELTNPIDIIENLPGVVTRQPHLQLVRDNAPAESPRQNEE